MTANDRAREFVSGKWRHAAMPGELYLTRNIVTSSLMRFGLILLACCLFPRMSEAQSFNCNQARTPTEVAICRDDELSRIDETKAVMFSRLVRSVSQADRRFMLDSQSRWLRHRDECGFDADCLRDRMKARLIQIMAETNRRGL